MLIVWLHRNTWKAVQDPLANICSVLNIQNKDDSILSYYLNHRPKNYSNLESKNVSIEYYQINDPVLKMSSYRKYLGNC